MSKRISVSLISHGQFALAKHVLDDLSTYCSADILEVILTINIKESISLPLENREFPVHIIHNPAPKGFGANHNAAFKLAKGNYFCVLNPDIRLEGNPFPTLVAQMALERTGVVAPGICNSWGEREDSARYFPTPLEILSKIFGFKPAEVPDTGAVFAPDWVAGMFMLFPAGVFCEMSGFDERYFLYYEDVDLCARLALAGYQRLVCQDVSAIHDARRTSHRNLRYALWHARSIIRFFCSEPYRRLKRRHCASSLT